MRRSVWGFLALVAIAIALTGAFATVAGAAERNPECLTCHETLDKWSVGPVDLATACKKCHTPGLIGTHPYHNPGNCKVCHASWGDSNRFAIPSWSGAEGSFSSSQSKDTSSSILHVIHATPRWMSSATSSVSQCASCHQPAACSACHSTPPSAKHSAHASVGSVSYPKHDPWVGTVANGIVGEDQTQDTASTGPLQCATAGCHNLEGTQGRTAVYKESHSFAPRTDYPEGNYVSTTGTWKLISAGPYTLGVAQQSNYANASVTATFTGSLVEVVTDKDPYRGKAEVWLDGVYKAEINCYSSLTQYERIVWRSADLTPTTHTIKIVVKGTQDPASRGAWVRLDAFRIYSSMPGSIAPKCTNCHPDKTSAHGTSYSHEASLTVGNEAGFTCNQCHELKMITEHKRPSAVTSAAPSVCDQCHTTYAPYNLTTPAFDYTCGWAPGGYPGCHQAANNQARHTNINPSHDSTAAASTDCRTSGCHGNDLRAIHNNSIPTNVYDTNCLTCHGTTKYPTSTNCVDSNCHVASGVISMDTHPTPAHLANPAGTEALRTGNKTCATCHELELTNTHFKSAAKTVGNEAIACNSCHGAAYLPAGWLTPPANTCVACHPADATKAGAPHEPADYATKHDFTPFGSNQSSCGAGGLNQSFCHSVNAADFIHDPVNPRHTANSDCTSCHTAAAKTGVAGVPAIVTCTTAGCHTATPHNMGRHLATASNECFRCHEKANGTVTNDVRDVHPTCETCHANPAYPNLTIGVATNDCVNCHKAGGVGGHAYSTPDPNHYVGSETTHTASSQTGQYSGYNCTSCHNMEMKPEHITKTKTNFAGVPLTYPDKCVACHEQRVDALPGGVWNKTCDQCHATKHGSQNAQHNATPDTLSGVLTTVTVEAEDFGTSATWPSDWQNWAPSYVTNQNVSAFSGYAAQIGWNATRTEYDFYKDINLASFEGTAVLTFYYQVNVLNASDFLVAEYSTNGGSTYTELFRQNTDQATWTKSPDLKLPAGGTVRVRFRGTFDASGEYGRVDSITLDARQRGASPGTIGANCGGAGCHATGDVSVIHNNSIPTNAMNPSCLTCHNPSPVQPKRDCNTAGCHNGGHNMAVHTAVASPECVGCHESNNVQAIHPTCNTCHANASYPNIVTGNTAECADCHNALEVGAKVYDPADPQHYASAVTTHTALETGTFQTYQCTYCHILELKPEHQKSSVNMPGYNAPPPVQKCIGCHETKVDAFTTAWDKRCASCHALTHGERATKHDATVVGASCGGTGCHNIADVSIIHNNSLKNNAPTMGDNNCATANCHADATNTARPESVPQTLDCMASGCHLGLVHSHSLDRTGSNYNNTTVTGCTNSGSGCHGTDNDTSPDFAKYHPANGCTSGACHASPSQTDVAFNNPQTCQNCHGGRSTAPLIYTGAPDAVSLTTATPNGHYSETTHTAGGLLNTAKARPDGLTSAACTTCHNPINATGIDGLWYQHQVLQGLGNTTCYECHSNAAYPGITAEVIGSWTTDQCTDCHNLTDMPSYSMHPTDNAPVVLGNVVQSGASPGTCDQAGCHANLDLHELHKGNGASTPASGTPRPDPQCNVCHDPLKQGWKPVEKSCGDGGACHITQPHLNIGPAHSVTALSEACIECHETTDLRLNHGFATTCSDPSATGCHNGSVPGLPSPVGKQECVDCHTPGIVGTRVYVPHDPEHYLGSETTHTASAQTGTFGAVTSVVATEGFNVASFPAAWTKTSTRVITNNVSPYEGSYYAQIANVNTTRQTDYFQRIFDTSSAASPTVGFYYQTLNFAADDYARLEYSTNGTTFTQLWNVTAIQSTWTTVGPLAIPRSTTLTLRWSASTNTNNSDMLRVDAITVKPGDGDPAACSTCHQMEMKPEHFKVSSEATRVPSIYGDKCVDCHENKVDAIGAAWDHKCTSCHPVATQHNGQAEKHDATALAPQCGGSGCHFISDVSVIHNNSSPSNPLYTNCVNTCHTSANVVPTTINCDSSGCHLGVQPHTHELDVTASDYNNTTVTGCTDSGAGCHGVGANANYATYHPNSGCTTGPCHTAANHNDNQFNNPNSCQNCHGGGATLHGNSIDVVGLTEAAPSGHYNETTHTAGPSSRTATMSAGGTITARCVDCHNDVAATGIDGIFAQHQGLPAPYANTGCWECHSNPAYPNVTTEVKTLNWSTNNCTDCHNTTNMGVGFTQHSAVAPVATATEAQGAGSCQATGCHTTLDLHALHKGSASTPPARAAAGCALTGCHDFTKQGRKPTGKSCGAGGACHNTAPTHPNEAAAHQTIDTANCARCHEGVGNTVFSDIRDVYKSSGFGNIAAHTCASCHNAGANLGATNTADCVDCHNATEQGGHAYTAYDPNHYYTASHDSSLTTTDNWSTANYSTTLSDYHGAVVSYSRACTTCHTIDLRTEHEKTSIAYNLGGKPDKCVSCHEGNGVIAGVDNWTARWLGGCGGEASNCHNMSAGVLHNNWGTKHDASTEVMSAPGSAFNAGSETQVALDNFGTTTTWPTAFTRSSTTLVTVQTGSARSGAAAQIGVNATRTEYNFYKTAGYALTSYAGGNVNFWYQVNVSDTADFLVCEYSTVAGGPYTELFRVNTDVLTWTQSPTLAIPGGSTIYVRFRGTFNATGEYGRVDDLLVNGVSNAGLGAALPANSSAATSCSSNPNATQCHDVTDVANIHSRTANSGCPICHVNNAQHPSNKNCQAAGCHVGVNVNEHIQSGTTPDYHESPMVSTAAGQPFVSTGVAGTVCTGCHDDSIANEHFVLGSYGTTPCSMCHQKSTNSGAPTNVTSTDTSSTIHADTTANNELCTDCHKTVTADAPHVQRIGDGGTPGTQFKTNWSGHRSWDTMAGAKTVFNTTLGDSRTITIARPAASGWILPFNGFTMSTTANLPVTHPVRCSDCHGSMSGATGPHGGSVTVKIASGYVGGFSTGDTYLAGTTAPRIRSVSGAGTPICAKCHDQTAFVTGNAVHNRTGDHAGTTDGKCINCHVKTPHAWKRPYLIGYITDPAPYQSLLVRSIAAKTTSPSTWSSGNCYLSGCSSHSSAPATAWQ